MPILVSLVVLMNLMLPGQVSAQTPSGGGLIDWSRGNCSYNFGSHGTVLTLEAVECVMATFLNVAISLIGIIILLMLVYGGFLLLFSSGNPQKVEQGKNVITFAVGGLLMAILSWSVLVLISQFTGTEEIKTFDIPSGPADIPSEGSSGNSMNCPEMTATTCIDNQPYICRAFGSPPQEGYPQSMQWVPNPEGSCETTDQSNQPAPISVAPPQPPPISIAPPPLTSTPVIVDCSIGATRCINSVNGQQFLEQCVSFSQTSSTYWQSTTTPCP